MMNSRVLSILKITNLEHRIVYDTLEGDLHPKSIDVDFKECNNILGEWKQKSLNFLLNALK